MEQLEIISSLSKDAALDLKKEFWFWERVWWQELLEMQLKRFNWNSLIHQVNWDMVDSKLQMKKPNITEEPFRRNECIEINLKF